MDGGKSGGRVDDGNGGMDNRSRGIDGGDMRGGLGGIRWVEDESVRDGYDVEGDKCKQTTPQFTAI